MKKQLFKLSAFALLMCLSLTAWADGTPRDLGTLTSFKEGKYVIYYEDASGIRHYLYAGDSTWGTTTNYSVIALSKGVEGLEETAYFLQSNGLRMSNPNGTGLAPNASTSVRDWESQPFYEKDGKFAIRCTNNDGENFDTQWWPNTYVNVSEDGLTLSSAAPSLGEALFLWKVEETAWSKVNADAVLASALETYQNTIWLPVELTTSASQFLSNCKDPSEGTYEGLIDNDPTTFFHSSWRDGNEAYAPHDLQVSIPGNTVTNFLLKYTDRITSNDIPVQMKVYGSNDGGETYSSLLTTVMMPVFSSGQSGEVRIETGNTPYTYYKFAVTDCYPSYRIYFHFAEFHLWTADEADYAAPKYEMESGSDFAENLLVAINSLQAVETNYTLSEDELAIYVAAVSSAEVKLKANAKVQYTVSITGNPSEAKVTIGGKEYSDGDTFKSAPISANDVTVPEINHYPYTLDVTGDKVTVTYAPFTVSSLDEITNSYAFEMSTKRGWMIAVEDGEDSYIGVTPSQTGTLADRSFALLKSDLGNYYLYNVGKKKFAILVDNKAYLADIPMYNTITIEDTKEMTGFRFRFKMDGYTINNNGSGELVVNSWHTFDDGNLHKLVYAGEYDFSEAVALINLMETHSFVTIKGAPSEATLTYQGTSYKDGEAINNPSLTRSDFTISHFEGYGEAVKISGHFITIAYTKLPFELTKDRENPKYYAIRGTGVLDLNGVTKYTTYFFYNNKSAWIDFGTLSDEISAYKWFFVETKDGDSRYIQMISEAYPTKALYLITGLDDNGNITSVYEILEYEQFIPIPTVTMSVTGVKYGTFVAPFPVELPQNVAAYYVNGVNSNNELELQSIGSTTIPENTPVIVYSATAFSRTFEGLPDKEGVELVNGMLTGVYVDTEAPVGSYVLMEHNGEAVFGKVLEGNQPTVGANHAYLTTTEGQDAPYLRIGGTTNIAEINAEENATVVYDLTGRRVETPSKGFYILNGKKMLIK